MHRRAIYAALTALAIVIFAAPPARSQGTTVYVKMGPPPPAKQVIIVSPGPKYIWVGGYHSWNGHAYVWVPGRWAMPPAGYHAWVPAHWVSTPKGWYMVPGHWRK